ncbi:MAG: trypsin-like peptidase domain-containing protein, partial [Candidatus Omnitrophica bacterium]|nr:trypsin-like peptidase domain-containing protein [Candidatus Omnitrophota bacterium]
MKRKTLFFALAVIIGVTVGFLIAIRLDILPRAETQAVKQEIFPFGTFNLEEAVINVANTTGKAVVSISTEHITKIGGTRRYYFSYPFGGELPFGEDEFFRRFFDDFFGELPEREYKQMGLGSGVIIDAEGYILTNQHVVGEADRITVTLPDGREFKGEIKGQDRRSDLAVIKINAHNLPVATLGNSDSLKIG